MHMHSDGAPTVIRPGVRGRPPNLPFFLEGPIRLCFNHTSIKTTSKVTVSPNRPLTSLRKQRKPMMSVPILDKLPFTLQCLPFGVISTRDSQPRCAVAIGDHAVDLSKYAQSGRLADLNDEDKNGVDFEHMFKQVSIATAFNRSHSIPIRRTRQLARHHGLTQHSPACSKHICRSGLETAHRRSRTASARSRKRQCS